MKRLGRIIFNVVTLLSLVLCIVLISTAIHDRRAMESYLRKLAPSGFTIYGHYSEIYFAGFKVPTWLAIATTAAMPATRVAVYAIGLFRRLCRTPPGLCPVCNYDLRATPDRCPECGHVSPKQRHGTSPTSVGNTVKSSITRNLIVLAILIVPAACHRSATTPKPPSTQPPASPTTRTSTAASHPATTQQQIPIVYISLAHPAQLTAQQLREIPRIASGTIDGRGPWFVSVLNNRDGYLSGIAYFLPLQPSRRLRKGHAIAFRSFDDHFLMGGAHQYVQVSLPDKPFGPSLELPSERNAPFPSPLQSTGGSLEMSDDDLVKLVDFARSIKTDDANAPIHRIEPFGHLIRIHTGWQVGPLYGSGSFFDVRRKNGGFELVGEIGRWVS